MVGGPGDLIGSIAEVVEATQCEGWVQLRGENWHVVSDTPLQPAQKVRVVARKGLVLEVVPVSPSENALSPGLSPAGGREGQNESLRDFHVNNEKGE